MTTMIATRNQEDVDNSDVPREGKTETLSSIGRVANNIDGELPISLSFFAEKRDLVSEIFSFLDPPSLLKMCRAMPIVSPLLTHQHVIGSVTNTLRSDTFDQNNECYRRNRHRYRHIQYHRIVVEKLIPNFQKDASTKQTPMQLLRSVSGRYCERCQLDLICVTGW